MNITEPFVLGVTTLSNPSKFVVNISPFDYTEAFSAAHNNTFS